MKIILALIAFLVLSISISCWSNKPTVDGIEMSGPTAPLAAGQVQPFAMKFHNRNLADVRLLNLTRG